MLNWTHNKLKILFLLTLPTMAQAQEVWQDQLKSYDREDVHSIHKKLYTKEGRHELTASLGGIFNNNGFILTTLQYEYHLFENLGIEVGNGGYGFQINDNNKLIFFQTSISFSPLYGKLSFFTWSVANFDIYVIGGGGMVRYSGLNDGSSFMGNIGAGYRFFINEFLSFKLEFRDYIYRSKTVSNPTILNNYALTGGFSVFLPFHQK